MKLKPVKTYREPSYATRSILEAHPELLRLVPKRWQTNVLVLTAVAAAGAIVALRWHAANAQQEALGARPAPATPQPVTASLVAPIFQHGKGQGAFGCVAVNPPAFLSEDEAREVVMLEAKTAGINFAVDAKTLPDIAVPLTSYNRWLDEKDKEKAKPESKKRSLLLDGWDDKRNIAFEYVSEKDYEDWIAEQAQSTVSQYEFLNAAKILRNGLATAKPAGAYGVFYDPMARYSDAAAGLGTSMEFTEKTLAPAGILVGWDKKKIEQKDGTITVKQGDHQLTLAVGSNKATADGKQITFATPVIEWHGTVYAPLQATAAALGVPMRWDAKEAQVTLVIPGIDWAPAGQVMVTQEKDPAKVLSLAFVNSDYRSQRAIAKDIAREDLRRQVQDFIAWLKAEKVI